MAELAVEKGGLAGLRDAAILLTGADAMLRVGELAAVQVEDISYQDDGSGRLHLGHSKTDQYGNGAELYLGPATMKAIERWQDASGIEDGPLWRRVTRECTIPRAESLHTQTVRDSIIKLWARVAGIKGRISGHSLRVGTAQTLARRGASMAMLMQNGRWRSPDMVARYTAGIDAGDSAVATLIHGS